MKILFWISAVFIAYTYAGYPFLLWLIARFRTRPILRKRITPTVSIIMAAHNEERTLPSKLENLRTLDYPLNLVQVIVVSDGSNDGTSDILRAQSNFLEPVILDQSCGKAAALNEAVKRATGEILVFMDARQSIDVNALSELTACFWDWEVGAVSGELILDGDSNSSTRGLGTYWNIEKMVRRLESASGSTVGTTGAIYAIRRSLYEQIPSGTILDDVVIPMNVVRQGRRVVFQPSATARDRLFTDKGREFSRKVRTITGNYQLLWLAPWLISASNPILLRFISHKLLRLLCPSLLIVILIASGMAGGPVYRVVFATQVVFYCLAACGGLLPLTRRTRLFAITSAFMMLNAAAALALYNVITGRNIVWRQGMN
jgi:biofilm PGA synthesis N-glycosyltransferase PgaC